MALYDDGNITTLSPTAPTSSPFSSGTSGVFGTRNPASNMYTQTPTVVGSKDGNGKDNRPGDDASLAGSVHVIALVTVFIIVMIIVGIVVVRKRMKERWSILIAANSTSSGYNNGNGNRARNDILILAVSDPYGHIISYQFQKRIRFVSYKLIAEKDDGFVCPICLEGNDGNDKSDITPAAAAAVSNEEEMKEKIIEDDKNDFGNSKNQETTTNEQLEMGKVHSDSNVLNAGVNEVPVDSPTLLQQEEEETRIENPNDVVMITCQHKFHRQCINEWLNRINDLTKAFVNESCPTCRKTVVEYKFIKLDDMQLRNEV